MMDNGSATRTVVDELRIALGKGGKLAVALEFAGKVEEARQVSAKVGDLRAELDRLMAGGAADGPGAGEAVAAGLRAANSRLQDDIVAVRGNRDLGGALAKALGRLDTMIAEARGLSGEG